MKITVPDSLADLTVTRYMAFRNADGEVAQIAALCGIDKSMVEGMDMKSMSRVLRVLAGIDMEDMNKHHLQDIVTVKGVDYGFHPNLSGMTLGEYIDLEAATNSIETDLPSALGVLYRKVEERYDKSYSVKPYQSGADLSAYGEFRMDVVFGALAFFLTLGADFVMNLAPYFQELKEAEAEQS